MEGCGSGRALQPSSGGSLVSDNNLSRLCYTSIIENLTLGYLELMFQVNGEFSSGMVSACVRRWQGELVYQSLAVDLPTGERVLLKGTPDNVVFKGYTQLR